MRGCTIAAIVLCLIGALVVGNAVYVHGVSRDLSERLEALPAHPDPRSTPAEIAAIREMVEAHMTTLSLSVNFTLPDRIVESLSMLEEQARIGDGYQYVTTLALLRDLCEDLARTERLHLENLF